MDFVFAFGIPGKIAACTKHNRGRNMLKIILLKNVFESIVFVSSMSIKHLPEIFLFSCVPLACLAETTHMYATQSADKLHCLQCKGENLHSARSLIIFE